MQRAPCHVALVVLDKGMEERGVVAPGYPGHVQVGV
jgi:hypothetical protein